MIIAIVTFDNGRRIATSWRPSDVNADEVENAGGLRDYAVSRARRIGDVPPEIQPTHVQMEEVDDVG
jgi:hypothetical protein